MRTRRLGVMGGTFDPIHHGHLVAASEVADLFDLDEVVFVPTGQPWQKTAATVTAGRGPLPDDGGRHRLQPAVLRQPGRHRPRRPHLHHRHAARPAALNPDTELYFITGADALASILSWHDAEELFALAHFVGVSRPGYELDGEHAADGLPDDARHPRRDPGAGHLLDRLPRRAAEGEPVWYLVPDGVVQYIAKHEL